MKKKRNSNPSQYIGLALNFGIILVISMVIMFKVGAWIDAETGDKRDLYFNIRHHGHCLGLSSIDEQYRSDRPAQ